MDDKVRPKKPKKLVRIHSRNFVEHDGPKRGYVRTATRKGEVRYIAINDSKNTVVTVKASDGRSDEEIRNKWLHEINRRLKDVSF